MMGFFSKLAAVVVTVVAAPVVLPAAAAAAAAGAAAAVAAGTAVVGAAGAAGAAVAGAAGTVATATGLTTAAATVGGAVGTAAGAVGLTSVAAATGTTAGAAAVGTITTSVAVGGAAGINAKGKFDEAEEIRKEAEQRYNAAKDKYDGKLNKTKATMKELAESKELAANDLKNFNEVFKKIKNPTAFGTITISNEYCKGVDTKVDFKAYPITLKKLSTCILQSAAAGDLAGVALTSGITSTITAAGTGTAMSALSGAAATNATMAALGGGTLASGGLGMAGGAIIAKGLVFAPALAIGGLLLNGKASEAIEKANEINSSANSAVSKMKESGQYLTSLKACMGKMNTNILGTHEKFTSVFDIIHDIVYIKKHIDAEKMTRDEKLAFYAGIGLSKVMEIQLTKTFIKEDSDAENLTSTDVVPVEEIEKCNYADDGMVAFAKLPQVNLSNVVDKVLENN
jgi:hypothetical protein